MNEWCQNKITAMVSNFTDQNLRLKEEQNPLVSWLSNYITQSKEQEAIK